MPFHMTSTRFVLIKLNKIMRQVDSYKHKGVQTINNIYTFDVETSLIVPSENPLEQTTREHYRDKVN